MSYVNRNMKHTRQCYVCLYVTQWRIQSAKKGGSTKQEWVWEGVAHTPTPFECSNLALKWQSVMQFKLLPCGKLLFLDI